MSVIDSYNEITAKKVIAELEKRNMTACYVPTKEEALKTAISMIEKGSSISWGGSESIGEVGIIEELYKSGEYNLIDRAKATDAEGKNKIMHDALSADYYLMSSNAITMDGELVNIDGNGNRVAALIYGPKNVIIIAGMNKVVRTEEDAMNRIRNYTAPLNTIRLGCDTPCSKTGYCHDCKSQATVCCQIVTTRFSRHTGRIRVILVGENLGY